MRFVGEIRCVGRGLLIESSYPLSIEDGKYSIEITDFKKSRSLNQNSFYFKLVREISKKINGTTTEDDIQSIHVNLLRMANAKYTDVSIPKEALETFKTLYKDIYVRGYDSQKSGNIIVRCLESSSKMTVEEMQELITQAIQYAQKVGVDTKYYEEVFG